MAIVEELITRIEQNNEFADRLLKTLEIMKLESKYQIEGKPNVFDKQFDDLGLITHFSLNPYYKQVPMPKIEFSAQEISKVLEKISPYLSELEIMLNVNLGQSEVEKQIETLTHGPIFYQREPNEIGIPTKIVINTRYKINFTVD